MKHEVQLCGLQRKQKIELLHFKAYSALSIYPDTDASASVCDEL